MKNKIQNQLHISCEDADLTTASNIEFYLRQGTLFKQYSPTVVSDHEMLVVIPREDAMKLKYGTTELQFAFTDAGGNPRASEVERIPVGRLLKEAGYDPI